MTPADVPYFLPASVARDQDFIVQAQLETMKLSYASGASPYTHEHLHKLLDQAIRDPKHSIQVLFLGSRPIGYYWYEVRPKSVVFILDLFVSERVRHQGFGNFLLQTILVKAKSISCTTAKLAVSVNNGAALSLYRNCGFTEVDATTRGMTQWLEMALDLRNT